MRLFAPSAQIRGTITYILTTLTVTLASAADIYVQSRGPYLTLGTNLTWGVSGRGGTNNTWLFNTVGPDQNVCVFITNKDPVNSKTFTLNIYQTPNYLVRTYTGNQHFFRALTVSGTPSPVGPNSTSSAYAQTTAAAIVAIQINSTSTGGQADIYVVQTPGSCGPVNSSSGTVQGMQAEGQTVSQNPILIAGKQVPDNIVRTVRINPYGALIASSYVETKGIIDVPTTETTPSTSYRVFSFLFYNSTASQISVTLKDSQANKVIAVINVPAQSYILLPQIYLEGFRVVASATGVTLRYWGTLP